MAGVATLRLLADARHGFSPSFTFLAVGLPQSGMVIDVAQDSEEDLISSGIDNQRWLRMFSQFPVTEATTIADVADYTAAQNLVRDYLTVGGRFADLSITYGTRTIISRRIKILSPVIARAQRGSVTGSGVTGTPLASVRAEWRWKCTEASQ